MTSHNGVKLSYETLPGAKPGLFWLGGYKSDMHGTKPFFMMDYASRHGIAATRFDYQGHGISDGDFVDGNIDIWLKDALAVLDSVTEGKQIVIGSSMGGWIALRLAELRPERVSALILICAAPDFSEEVWQELSDAEKENVKNGGTYQLANDYAEPYPMQQHFFDDSKKHLMLHRSIDITCPVRLLHGKADADVPWQKSEDIKQRLASQDVTITYIDDGDHRLSRDQDLAVLGNIISGLLQQV